MVSHSLSRRAIDLLAEQCQREERAEEIRINRRFWQRYGWSMYYYYQRDASSGMGLSCMGYSHEGSLYGAESVDTKKSRKRSSVVAG